MGKSTIVYIDGFNFYYGFLRGTLFKWLDLQNYFVSLRQDDSIQKIKYFTACVKGDASLRQRDYLRALSTSSLVEVIYGVYKYKDVKCEVRDCNQLKDKKFFKKPEEKRTDVNIAITMLDDAYQGKCERMILVSADSDLVPVVELIRKRFPIEIFVYIPSRNSKDATAASELRNAATKNYTLRHGGLSKKAQFPNPVFTPLGIGYKKPLEWNELK